ncbi:MAG: enoyl-CoA hydratase/isomerase family protein [Actinobacteria bacterium]|nr:enoyl-CoA hydratase/isomerase family protein [Actinomycetota bacterium]
MVSLTRDGHIARLRLERPEKLNAQTHRMWFELRQIGDAIGSDTSIRALIVSGAGRSFSAGLDTAVLTDFFGSAAADDLEGLDSTAMVRRVQYSFSWLAETPYPTIAAVQGHALGAGCQLALACDLRIAADDVSMGLLETNWGLMPDLGGTVWLPELVGPAKAKELMWLAERLDADEALRLGVVNRVVPRADLDSAVDELALRLAARPPLAVAAVKRAVAANVDGIEAGLAAAGAGQLRCLASNDLAEAGAAWLEGRAPDYTGT